MLLNGGDTNVLLLAVIPLWQSTPPDLWPAAGAWLDHEAAIRVRPAAARRATLREATGVWCNLPSVQWHAGTDPVAPPPRLMSYEIWDRGE